MSVAIRKQSIISSLVIYLGFAIGMLNTLLYTNKAGWFTTAEYGYTTFLMQSIIPIFYSLASLSMPSYIYKFFPYYKANLNPRENDMLTLSLFVGFIGVILVSIFGLVFQDVVVRKYSANGDLFVKYYYWVFPIGLGFTLYGILEAYAWGLHKSVFTNFLKEVQWRLFSTLLIVLFIFNIIPDFSVFIKWFSFTYLALALILFGYLFFTKKINITFKLSRVTIKFWPKIKRFCTMLYLAGQMPILAQAFDTLVIASVLPNGMEKAGIFAIAQLMTSLVAAPQRGIVAASIPHLAQAWKDKNLNSINNIYKRSSINQLIFSALIFILVLVNYDDAIITFGLTQNLLLGFTAFIFLGLNKVIEMGTGVNNYIIGTSNYWRFELTTGIILVALTLPLTYIFTKSFGIVGPPIASLISIIVYNAIRIFFLWKKFRLFPFDRKTIYTILLTLAVWIMGYYFFRNMHSWAALFSRSIFMCVIFGAGVYFLNLTPDLKPVLQAIGKRLGRRK
ncbi:MAG: polysaccharide biosynthesis C-terminal domain-containing protein [Niabella sp.]